VRFIAAIVFFVVAVVGVGLGVAQRTIWAPPDRIKSTIELDSTAPVTVIDGSALNAFDGRQTIDIIGGVTAAPVPAPESTPAPELSEIPNPLPSPPDASDTPEAAAEAAAETATETATETLAIAAAYGRTADVIAWVKPASYTLVTFDAELGELVSETVTGSEATVPELFGSDLWFADYQAESELGITLNVPDSVSMLIVSDGVLPAPQQFSITWPLENSTPFSTPLILGGGAALIVGLVLLLWALLHLRKQHGPRRKTPKMPRVPKPSRYRPVSPRAVLGRPKGRRAVQRSALIPTLLLGSTLLVACTGGGAIVVAPPTPEPSVAAETPAVAVSENQLRRIVSRISATVNEADTARDPVLAATRLTGPALELRTASYLIQASDAAFVIAPAIPEGEVQLTLPERLPDEGNTWPRRAFTIVQAAPTVDDAGVETRSPPRALLLVQDDPRSQYRVYYAITVSLPDDAERPKVAPATLGAPLLPKTTPLLAVSPESVAAAYADLLLRGEQSETFALFQPENDTLAAQIGVAAKAARQSALPSTAAIAFTNAVGNAEVYSFVTNDGGALVMLYLTESEAVTPTQAGAAVNAPATVAALSGRTQSDSGIVATYGIQILFSVPPVGSDAQVVLLGYTQGLISAGEL
jgi:hypothetical protein